MKRIPRKLKKIIKKMYKHRYKCKWLKCDNILVEYIWFKKNPFKWNMNKQLLK